MGHECFYSEVEPRRPADRLERGEVPFGRIALLKISKDACPRLADGARRSLALACATLAVLSVMAAATGVARADDSGQATASAADPQVDLDIVNANLLTVVRMLRLKSGAQIVVVSGDQSYHPVTLTVSGSLSTVLRYVAVSAGATVTRNADGVYIFRPASSALNTDTAISPSTDQSGADADVANTTDTKPAATRPIGPIHVERIVLQNVDPNFILKMLNDTSGYRDTNPYHDPDAMQTFGPIPGSKDYQGDIIQGNSNINMLAQSIAPTTAQPSVPMDTQTIGTSSSTTANRAATDSTDQAHQYVTPGGGGFMFGNGGGGAGGFNPGQRGPGAPGAFGPNGANGQGQSLRPEGIQWIGANEQDNSLLVAGDAQGIQDLKRIISLLDLPPKQVQIKVEFITANVTDVNTFGISWDFLPLPNLEVGTNQGSLQSASDTFLSYAQGNMVARLFTFLSQGHGKNISSPIITTTNNIPASIYENIQIPYVTTTTVAGATGGAVQGQSVSFLNVPTGLTVLPRINGDNSVTLTLSPTLQVPGVSVIPNGPPPVTSEGLTTIRTVANNETMVLGGLVTKDDTNTTTKVPILGDLPIIGGLFRTRNENINNTELLIFVTPTVLPAPNVAAGLSGQPPTAETGGGVGVTP